MPSGPDNTANKLTWDELYKAAETGKTVRWNKSGIKEKLTVEDGREAIRAEPTDNGRGGSSGIGVHYISRTYTHYYCEILGIE